MDEIAAGGPVPFDEVIERALYDPDHGFYATGQGRAGTRGDFLTSPEVGPLFGAVVARALDAWWRELGSPDPFTVVEAAAGVATLARSVLAAAPACAPALDYVLVERSDTLRAHHGDHLTLSGGGTGPDPGPRVWSRSDLPPGPITGVILANELLDNLAFGQIERQGPRWHRVLVDVGAGPPAGAGLVEVTSSDHPDDPDDPTGWTDLTDWAQRAVPDAAPGTRLPDQRVAGRWVTDALDRLGRGWLVVLDYGDRGSALASRGPDQWIRTYRGHQRGGAPLADLGRQDVTCEVALDQLTARRPPSQILSQAEFLTAHGIDDLVAEGRRVWVERGHIGDLEAIRARSRIGEAEALTDPTGLGGFTTLVWHRP
jgi:SAM-dependent MidA family methyltransferase